jgi:bifunctional DNase/RNase
MTHDLFKSFAHEFDYTIREIIISDLKEGVFFAKIVCESQDKVIEIDARPSDAIAIGLRFKAPIYTYEAILAEAGIEFTGEEESDFGDVKSEMMAEKSSSGKKKPRSLKDFSIEKLNEMLKKAIEKEDYEQAAKIRDELGKRN